MTPHINFYVFAICKALLGSPLLKIPHQDTSGQNQELKLPSTQKQVSKLKELKFNSLGVKKHRELNGNDPSASSVKRKENNLFGNYSSQITVLCRSEACALGNRPFIKTEGNNNVHEEQQDILLQILKSLDFYFVSLLERKHQTLLLGVELIYFTVL